MTQHERILDYMDRFGSITPMDAIFDLGITKLATRIGELRQLGVPEAQIDVSDECTFCRHDKYWSHRWTRGRRGSQAAGIVL